MITPRNIKETRLLEYPQPSKNGQYGRCARTVYHRSAHARQPRNTGIDVQPSSVEDFSHRTAIPELRPITSARSAVNFPATASFRVRIYLRRSSACLTRFFSAVHARMQVS
jgi:hypothetical protein